MITRYFLLRFRNNLKGYKIYRAVKIWEISTLHIVVKESKNLTAQFEYVISWGCRDDPMISPDIQFLPRIYAIKLPQRMSLRNPKRRIDAQEAAYGILLHARVV